MMLTIYKSPTDTVTVIDGDPPSDQSALIASLQAQLASMTADRDALAAKLALVKADVDKAETDIG